MKWFYFNLKDSWTNTLLVFEQFDEDTRVMHVLFTVHETNAWFIFRELLVLNAGSVLFIMYHCFGLPRLVIKSVLFYFYPDFSDFRYSHKRQMNNSSRSIATSLIYTVILFSVCVITDLIRFS